MTRAAARSLDSAFVPWPDRADGEGLRMWLVKAWLEAGRGMTAAKMGLLPLCAAGTLVSRRRNPDPRPR